jgi:hypothetical protein
MNIPEYFKLVSSNARAYFKDIADWNRRHPVQAALITVVTISGFILIYHTVRLLRELLPVLPEALG